ncbi:MAG: ArsA family ATPase [Haloferacaceae archaeon]
MNDTSGETDGAVDVEPVESVDDAETLDVDAAAPATVDAPKYVLYGGKGGVGKTTCAAATGLASATAGTPTLVVSTDPAHSLSDTLETQIPADPERIREEIPLFAAEIDPDATMEAAFGGDPLGGLGQMGEAADESPLGPLLGGGMPGADEAAAMRQLIEYLDDPRFERVVVDTAPTGHTLRLLELPELMDSMVGRLLSMREKFGGMLGQLGGMFGEGGEMEEEPPGLTELRERIERLRTVLRDPDQTDFRVVTVPEEMSVVEAERLVDRLDEYGIPVDTLVVNRVMENLADVTQLAESDREMVVSPDTERCEFCRRRWEVQRGALERATDLFRGRTVRRVPLLAEEVRGERALRVVAACLG